MSTIFNVQADVVCSYQASADIIKSVLQVGLSDDTHPVVLTYLDHLGSWLGASPRSMEMVRAAVCCHGSVTLRKLGLMVGIKPMDTARLLADCSGGVAWLTWEAALLECYSNREVALFQQEAGRMIGLKSIVLPHTRELLSAIGATAPRLGTVSFPEHYAKICGAMRQALFAATEHYPAAVAEAPLITDVIPLLVRVAEAYKERTCIVIHGQQSVGWLAATLTWIYGEAVEIVTAGKIIKEAELRGNLHGQPPLLRVELSDEDEIALTLDYFMDRERLVSSLTSQSHKDPLASFGPRRSRADQYFQNWLACTSPVSMIQMEGLAAAAAQLTCGLLRAIHVTNEGNETGLRAETQGAGKQLVNVLKLPGTYSDVRRVRAFFSFPEEATVTQLAKSQLQVILAEESGVLEQQQKIEEGGSTTALAFLAKVPSLREVYGRMVREILRVGIRGENECHCVLPGSGPEAFLPSAHESHCGVYQAASLGVELIATCICSLFIEGPTSPRLTMFNTAPLRWAISKAIEQSILTGSALISGADMMKSIFVVAGYNGDYEYGPLIVSCGGQALVLAAINDMKLSPLSIGRIMAFPGAILHRGQYYERLLVGSCRQPGGDILRQVTGPISRSGSKSETPLLIEPSAEGAAQNIELIVHEDPEDLRLVVRSRQYDGTTKEHDLWHCVTSALTANVLGDCSHDYPKPHKVRGGETIKLVGTGTNMSKAMLDNSLTVALTYDKGFDRLLACGVGINIVVQTSGCLQCAFSACKQIGCSYIIS